MGGLLRARRKGLKRNIAGADPYCYRRLIWMKQMVRFQDLIKFNVSKAIIGALILVPLLYSAAQAGWSQQTIEMDRRVEAVSTDKALAVDSSGKPHLIYKASDEDSYLYYAYYNGSTWQRERVASIAVYNGSLVLDSKDRPHIIYFYYESNKQAFYYAYFDGNSWQTKTLVSLEKWGIVQGSLALDPDDHPHISYSSYYHGINDYNNWELKYAYFDGNSWQVTTVDQQMVRTNISYGVNYANSLALDSNNRPHISYVYTKIETGLESVNYAYFDGNSWQGETLSSGKFGQYHGSSLALDSNGRPQISYYDYYAQELKYIYFDGNAWQTTTVDQGNRVINFSLALDHLDRPHIGYLVEHPLENVFYTEVRYAYFDGASWQVTTLDSKGGFYISLDLDPNDNPHLAYSDWDAIKYAYLHTSQWEISSVDIDSHVGSYSSIALDSKDRPYIIYQKVYPDMVELKYTTYDGNTWTSGTIDSTGGNIGEYNSLALDYQDRPHISYYDATNQDLKYAHFDGNRWVIETVDSEGNVGEGSSLALDSINRLHIAYEDSSSTSIKYALFDGHGWQIQSIGSSYYRPYLALDANDLPHVIYKNRGEDSFRYTYYTGTKWETEDLNQYIDAFPLSLSLNSKDHPRFIFSYELGALYTYREGSRWVNQNLLGLLPKYTSPVSLALDSTDRPHIIDHGSLYLYYTPSLTKPHSPYPNGEFTAIPSTLSWTTGDPDLHEDLGITYDVYLDTFRATTLVSDDQASTSYTPIQPLEPDKTYYWKVIARDNQGNEISSDVWFFHIQSGSRNYIPYTPSNPSPASEATNQPINTTLTWQGGDPDPGDTVTYDLYFGTSSAPSLIASAITNTSYNPGNLNYPTTYYWQIVARDNHGATSTSPIWKFGTAAASLTNNPPTTPSNPAPSDNAINQAIDLTLSWSGGDPDAGDTVSYDLYFGTTSSPPLVTSGLTEASYSLNFLRYSTKYYWRVVARDNHGAEAGGAVWSFTTLPPPNQAPSAPTGLKAAVEGKTVYVQWQANSETDIDHYNIYVGSSPKVYNIDGSPFNVGNITSLTAPDVSEETYYLALSAVNSAGQESSLSEEIKVVVGAKPIITIRSNKSSYSPGDTLTLSFSISNPTASTQVMDVFLGIIAPDGSIYFFDSSPFQRTLVPAKADDPRTFIPANTSLELGPGYDFPLTLFFSVTLPTGLAEGTYQAFAALAEAGSLQSGITRIIGNISISSFIYSP